MSSLSGLRIQISGIVQGVGFRPFVYGLAQRLNITGWVRNTSTGVEIEVNGTPEILESFRRSLISEAPPLAIVDDVKFTEIPAGKFNSFQIMHSQAIPEGFQPISPDMDVCDDCLRELFDPNDRRYLYPFINCTNCGPRFTIIEDIPYDRPNTTMSIFPMCEQCSIEYNNPLDRRFHAQPIACPLCGPHVWLEIGGEANIDKQAEIEQVRQKDSNQISIRTILRAQELLLKGSILAIKGIGGFHLACDATNITAVQKLRQRKLRVDKPFALMMPDIATVNKHCYVNSDEQHLLETRQRPIVILQRRPESSIAPEIAPGQNTIGVMLPYSPLHHLLFHNFLGNSKRIITPTALVMTSGNLSEEPIAFENSEARRKLGPLADAFLMHNRPIRTRCDDSVVRVFRHNRSKSPAVSKIRAEIEIPIRRSRGFTPFPVQFPYELPPILATGAELKNTFCLSRDRYAFLSQHIGDLENFETLQSFEDGISHFERLFRVKPEIIAYDLHPDYLATRYALKRAENENLLSLGIQHHYAHIISCMAENRYLQGEKVIGISFDGTGYGEDGAIWGGEFMLADYHAYHRIAHLQYVPLPGGERAIREPWRMALTWLAISGLPWSHELPSVIHAIHKTSPGLDVLRTLDHQIQSGINSPKTSSMGRLFDAISALVGVRQEVNYEAQAAIELEALVDPTITDSYEFEIVKNESDLVNTPRFIINPSQVFRSIIYDLNHHQDISVIASRFHNSVAGMVTKICCTLREKYLINTVALSGGVWQNIFLLSKTIRMLERLDFDILLHRQVPCNDGGLSLGQLIVAANNLDNIYAIHKERFINVSRDTR